MIGLDIGTHSVKLVHLEHRNGRRRLLSAVEEPALSESGQDEEARVEAVRKALQRAGLRSGRGETIVTAVSGSGTAVKQVEFPLLTDEELASSVRWQAGKRLPFGPDEAVLDYQVLSRDEASDKMNVLLVAVTRVHLGEHLKFLKKAAVDPLIIDLSPLALANAVLETQELEEGKAVVVLDIGASTTILDVFAPGEFFFTRDIAVTGRQLAGETPRRNSDDSRKSAAQQETATLPDADAPQDTAPERKEQAGQQRSDGPSPEAGRTPLDRLVFEIRRSLTYYENRRGRGGFEKLFLAGGGMRLPQLSDHLHNRLGVAVERFNPLKSIDVDGDQDDLVEKAPRLALAFGLALRTVGKKDV
jgi:type IV pilus assembly protein PilM